MKSEEEKIREMLLDFARPNKNGASGEHLRDEDFIRLIKSDPSAETEFTTNNNDHSPVNQDEFASLRRHLADCDSCLAQFKDFYAFYAPAEKGEPVAASREIEAAWQSFAPRIVGEKEVQKSFWTRIFPAERKTNYLAAFGWGFTALLLLSSIVSVFVAYQAKNENSQLAGQIENQKQDYEKRLNTLEESAQNRDLAEREKAALAAEKDELQKQIAALQTEIERAKQEKTVREKIASPVNNPPAADNSLVAINTPIYDIFPADSAVRGGEQSKNNLVVPRATKSIVLILNAAGRADFPAYRAELVSNSGENLWRGAGLKKDNLGNFTFTINRAALKNGVYRLKLLGQNNGGTAQIVAEYPLTISLK